MGADEFVYGLFLPQLFVLLFAGAVPLLGFSLLREISR